MEMAEPIFDRGDIHICVLLEQGRSSNFLTPLSSWPLLFTHANKTFTIAINRPNIPNIRNISKYIQTDEIVLWQVDNIPERTVDFDKLRGGDFMNELPSIVNLILEYKVVYFIHFPFEYFEIFERLNYEFNKIYGGIRYSKNNTRML